MNYQAKEIEILVSTYIESNYNERIDYYSRMYAIWAKCSRSNVAVGWWRMRCETFCAF